MRQREREEDEEMSSFLVLQKAEVGEVVQMQAARRGRRDGGKKRGQEGETQSDSHPGRPTKHPKAGTPW